MAVRQEGRQDLPMFYCYGDVCYPFLSPSLFLVRLASNRVADPDSQTQSETESTPESETEPEPPASSLQRHQSHFFTDFRGPSTYVFPLHFCRFRGQSGANAHGKLDSTARELGWLASLLSSWKGVKKPIPSSGHHHHDVGNFVVFFSHFFLVKHFAIFIPFPFHWPYNFRHLMFYLCFIGDVLTALVHIVECYELNQYICFICLVDVL